MQFVGMKSRGFFKLYQSILARHPYLVQGIQAGTLMGAGDLISQTLVERKSFRQVDYIRALRFGSIGFFVGGPALRIWYGLLQKHLGQSGKTVALKKVFVDQAVFAPAFLFILLVMVGTLKGNTWEATKKELETNYFDVLKTNYVIWPWVQIINFYYVPLQYQVLLVQSVALFWNTYLSWKTNKQHVDVHSANEKNV